MTKRQLTKIYRTWQRRLGLEKWDIKINWDEPTTRGEAVTWRCNDYDEGHVHFETDWVKWTNTEANLFCVHELVHLFMRDVEQASDAGEETIKNPTAKELYRKRFYHDLEGAIERLAHSFVELVGEVK